MLGDSFCKCPNRWRFGAVEKGFQSPCLGTLFARKEDEKHDEENDYFQSPCLGTLFASKTLFFPIRKPLFPSGLSIPMLGDSFCKLPEKTEKPLERETFNPHAWGLFLQVEFLEWQEGQKWLLSIPMLGDSFCKRRTRSPSAYKQWPFNPHAWGLFLQDLRWTI